MKRNKILIPLDGSETSERVLTPLGQLFRKRPIDATLLRVMPSVVSEAVAALGPPSPKRELDYLEEVRRRVPGPDVKTKPKIATGEPESEILRAARTERASMIAMATHGRKGLSRLVLGSTAEGVLTKSPVPLLLIHPEWSYDLLPSTAPEEAPIQRILFTVDEDGKARDAVPIAASFARDLGARTVLLHVLPHGREDAGTESPHASTARAALRKARMRGVRAAERLLTVEKDLARRGVETVPEVITGDAATGILSACRALKIDLIVMTKRRKSGLARVFGKGVVEAVLRDAKIPLLVVPEGGGRKARSGKKAAS